MNQAVLRIERLPESALDAATVFHMDWLPRTRHTIAGGCDAVVIVVPPAPYDHADWRQAAARDLARSAAPVRVNIVAGDDEQAIAATLAFLEGAPGITGQYLPVVRS